MLKLSRGVDQFARPTPWREFLRCLAHPGDYTFINGGRCVRPVTAVTLLRFMAQSFQHGFILRPRAWRWANKKTKL